MVIAIVTLIPLGSLGVPSLSKMMFLGLRVDLWLHILTFLPLLPLLYLHKGHRKTWHVVVAGLLIAALAEGIHHPLPYRSFDIYDLVGNLAGLFAGVMVLPVVVRLKHNYFN